MQMERGQELSKGGRLRYLKTKINTLPENVVIFFAQIIIHYTLKPGTFFFLCFSLCAYIDFRQSAEKKTKCSL